MAEIPDLVTRLRGQAEYHESRDAFDSSPFGLTAYLLKEAADEIERLRDDLDRAESTKRAYLGEITRLERAGVSENTEPAPDEWEQVGWWKQYKSGYQIWKVYRDPRTDEVLPSQYENVEPVYVRRRQ